MSLKIKCEYCDGTISKVRKALPFKSKVLGTVSVPNVEQHICSNCGNSTLSLDEASKVTQFIRDKEQHAINSLPVSDFISPNQAAELLGISKQAFSKHPRIKRGFIYAATIDGKKFYYKRSVEAFKETRDGKISLNYLAEFKQVDVEPNQIKQQENFYVPWESFGRQPFKANEFKVYHFSPSRSIRPEIDMFDSMFPTSFIVSELSKYTNCKAR